MTSPQRQPQTDDATNQRLREPSLVPAETVGTAVGVARHALGDSHGQHSGAAASGHAHLRGQQHVKYQLLAGSDFGNEPPRLRQSRGIRNVELGTVIIAEVHAILLDAMTAHDAGQLWATG